MLTERVERYLSSEEAQAVERAKRRAGPRPPPVRYRTERERLIALGLIVPAPRDDDD